MNTTNRALASDLQRHHRLFAYSILKSLAMLLATSSIGAPAGTAQTTSAAMPSNLYAQALIQAGPLLIGAGDLIDVEVFGTPELSGKLRVDQNGLVNLIMGGALKVGGLTPSQAGAVVEEFLLTRQIMLNPHVNVLVLEFATGGVTMLGEVKVPGRFTLFGAHSLYDALSSAGGPTNDAGSTITITHQSDPQHPNVIPVTSPNYSELQRLTPVAPGDTIFVSRAASFYVVGDVGRPGVFSMPNGQPVTLLEALAMVSGLNHTAAVSKASIIRGTPSGAETIPVDLNQVMKNMAPNLILQAKDVLVVPRSGVKVFLETAIPGATTAVVSSVSAALIVR